MLEMGLLHYRGNFHRWPMYVPIVFPPFFALSGLVLLVTGAGWALPLYAVMSGLLVLMGLVGMFFHIQGTARQTGGFTIDNVLVGPPIIAPLGFSILGTLGLVAWIYWS